jgi:predicted GNAT superfamily acetyltransferase
MTATAEETARLAAKRARVEVRELRDVLEMERADRLFAGVWGGDEQDAVSVNMMKALAHAGHYVAGAWRDGSLAGASVGFFWAPGGRPRLHSHISGVAREAQGGGVGSALKLHQAAWAIERGVSEITWTFDPLVRRNAWFNLVKLGARAASYHPDFYGPMKDGINGGDASDRCLAVWDLSRGIPEPTPPAPSGGARVILREGGGGEPEVDEPDGSERQLACQVPVDVVALRAGDPALGRRWRLALRSTMGRALQDGYSVVTMTKDGHYLLERSRT